MGFDGQSMAREIHIRTVLLLCALCALILPACSDSGGDDAGSGLQDGIACSPSTCAGCCALDGCKSGQSPEACGAGGLSCVICAAGAVCAQGQCIASPGKCNLTNCASGCCRGDDCLSGVSDEACGEGGRECTECGSMARCQDQRCECDPGSCTGCCDEGICKAGTDQSACGSGGQACVACGAQEGCLSGQCKTTGGCSTASCGGCCDGAQCRSGTSTSYCGKGGEPCVACKTGEACALGVCNDPNACGPGSCAGCCAGSSCLTGTIKENCGSAGGLCSTCSAHHVCDQGSCRLDTSSLWGITVVDAEIDQSKEWDTLFNTAPDPYVTIDISTLSGKTAVEPNTYFPNWSELVGSINAGAILNVPIEVRIYDSDTLSDQLIGACGVTVPENVLLSGTGIVNGCGTEGHVQKLTLKFTSN